MDGGGGGGGGSARRSSSWEREEQFRQLLHKAAKKASKEMIDTIADVRTPQGLREVMRLWRMLSSHSNPQQ